MYRNSWFRNLGYAKNWLGQNIQYFMFKLFPDSERLILEDRQEGASSAVDSDDTSPEDRQ